MSEKERIINASNEARSSSSSSNTQINTKKEPTRESTTKSQPQEDFNILKDYIWTLSENKNIIVDYVPKLIATEYNIETSPLVQNLRSSLTIGMEGAKQSLSMLKSAANAILPNALNINQAVNPEWAKTFTDGNSKSETLNATKDYFGNLKQKLGQATNAFMSSEMNWNNSKLKELYDHLYILSRTGKKFIFPYLDDEFLTLTNTFSEGNEYLQFSTGLFNVDTSNAKSTLKKFSDLPALVTPGAFIQMPQFYNFENVGEPSVTISFPLYNTQNTYETQKNLKFVKLFGLNNMPYRKDLIAVDPTRIYDIVIPGKANFPFCYVSDYSVRHIGTKSLHGEEIYPEAYEVRITFTSLIKFDANMYIESMHMANTYVPPPGRNLPQPQEVKKEISQAEQFKLNAIEKSKQQDAFAEKMARAEKERADAIAQEKNKFDTVTKYKAAAWAGMGGR